LKIEANDFKGDGETALWGEGDNIVIKGNYFGPTNLTGMNCNGLNNPTIENNYVEVNGYGFQLTTSNGGILQNNTFIGVQADYYDGINYLRGIDVFGTRFSGPNSNGLIIRNNTFQDFTSSGTINPDDQYRGIHIRQGATGITITGNEFINTHTGLGIVSATPAVSGIIMTGNDLSGVQLGVNNGSANNVDATNNYWGTCPSVSGIATYFPYWSTISGTPGSFVFDNPINNITASASSATICLGQSVTLSGATGSNFEWFNPAGTSLGLGVNKVVTPAASGSLTYTVTGKDLNGCAGGTASATFTVNPALVAEITQTGTGPYTLTATAGSSYTYAWSNGATTQSITVNPAVTSTFSVIITSGPCTASASKTIDVVYVSAGANQSICPGGSAQLNATISGVTPTLYAWSPATGLSNTAIANPVATPASTTTYTVTINATYTAAVTITVRPKPTANAGDDKTIFVGQSTVLTGVGSLGTPSYNYIWTPGSLTTASITVSPAATQTYNLVVTDAFGCASDADQATVTVNAMPASGNTVTGTISYAFGTVNAQMHDVAITLTPVLGGASYTGTSAASGNGTYSIPGVPDATYYVYLHSPKPWGGVTSADITAIANHYRASRPCLLTGIKRLAGDVYLNSAAASVNVDDKNEVQARINNSAYTFPGDWVFTKTSDISVNPFPAQFANDGYSGGSAFSSIQIIVAAATPASLVNNFSALCYGDVNASYNGVKTTEINNPTVYDGTTEDWFELSNYPNPFVGQTNFTYNQAVEGEATIQIFNLMGGLMGKIVNPDRSEGSHKIAFDGSRLAPGIYIYVFTLRTKDDVLTQNGKMVIVK
jgi:parallel beta-helix repeat protein